MSLRTFLSVTVGCVDVDDVHLPGNGTRWCGQMLLVVVAIVHSERKSRVIRRVRLVNQLMDLCHDASAVILECCEDAHSIFRVAIDLSASSDSSYLEYVPHGSCCLQSRLSCCSRAHVALYDVSSRLLYAATCWARLVFRNLVLPLPLTVVPCVSLNSSLSICVALKFSISVSSPSAWLPCLVLSRALSSCSPSSLATAQRLRDKVQRTKERFAS